MKLGLKETVKYLSQLLGVLVLFGITPAFGITGDFDTDGDVDRNDYNILMTDVRGPAPHDLVHDLNGDGAVNRADARTLLGLCTLPRCAVIDPPGDTTAPVIVITSPTDQAVFPDQMPITVSGTIDDNTATVTVNGIAALVDQGTFTANGVPLQESLNTLTVTATDPAGNTSTTSIQVTASLPNDVQMMPIFGPTDFTKTGQGMETFSGNFQNCEPSAQYKLVVVNGNADASQRVLSGSIKLNGQKVVSAQELTSAQGRVERPILVQMNNLVELEGSGPSQSKVTISVECTANCLGITIGFPADGETISTNEILVKGAVTTSSNGEVGVLINDRIRANVHERNFASPALSLPEGPTALTAMVMNSCQGRAATSIQIEKTPSKEPDLGLDIDRERVLTNEPVRLSLSFSPGLLIDSVTWDFEGDGTNDVTGPDLDEIEHAYTVPGLYLPSVKVVNTEGNILERQASLVVIDLSNLETAFQNTWSNMVDALRQGEIEQALTFITPTRREKYRELWTFIQENTDNGLIELANNIDTSIKLLTFRTNDALMISQNPILFAGTELDLEIRFVPDQDGAWRIYRY